MNELKETFDFIKQHISNVELPLHPLDKPIHEPSVKERVVQVPLEWNTKS